MALWDMISGAGGDYNEIDDAGDDDGDDVGYEEIVAGDDVIVGALNRARTQLAARGVTSQKRTLKLALTNLAKKTMLTDAMRARVQAAAAKNAIGVRPMNFDKAQLLPAPFDSNGNVAAGASVTITITAPVLWKPERLFIPSNIGTNWSLDRLQVGLQTWLLTASRVPCLAFSEQATDNILRLDTLQIGQQLTSVFTNRSGAPQELSGMWKGFVVF